MTLLLCAYPLSSVCHSYRVHGHSVLYNKADTNKVVLSTKIVRCSEPSLVETAFRARRTQRLLGLGGKLGVDQNTLKLLAIYTLQLALTDCRL